MSDRFEAKIEKIGSSVWSHCVVVPEQIADKYLVGEKRVLCTFNDEIQVHAALMSGGAMGVFININKENRKKLGLGEGDKVYVEIESDTSKYGIPFPEEMEELLKIDDDADKYFHQLTRGKQRSLLYQIGKPKNSDTRLKKAIVIVDYLKMTRGKLDFKELNEAFKNSEY